MQHDEFSVTMRTSLHRREALSLIVEGYSLFFHASFAVWRKMLSGLRHRITAL